MYFPSLKIHEGKGNKMQEKSEWQKSDNERRKCPYVSDGKRGMSVPTARLSKHVSPFSMPKSTEAKQTFIGAKIKESLIKVV